MNKRENQEAPFYPPLTPETDLFAHGPDTPPVDPYDLLAESLGVLQEYGADGEELRGIVVRDAHDLAGRLLPQSVVDDLGLQVKRMDDIGFEQTPNIRALFLLVRSFDATGDETLRATLEHIMDTVPPQFSELLVIAFKSAQETGTPIMETFTTVMHAVDQKVDGYTTERKPFHFS